MDSFMDVLVQVPNMEFQAFVNNEKLAKSAQNSWIFKLVRFQLILWLFLFPVAEIHRAPSQGQDLSFACIVPNRERGWVIWMVKTDWAFVEPYQNKALIWVWDWGDYCFSAYWWNVKFSHCGSAEDLSSCSVDFWVEKAKLWWKAKLVLVRGMEINLKSLRVELSSHFLLKIDHSI